MLKVIRTNYTLNYKPKIIQKVINYFDSSIKIDGIIGRKTKKAINKYNSLLNELLVTYKLVNNKNKTIKYIVKECLKYNIIDYRQISYILATIYHETNGTFLPVKEAYWLSESWRKNNLKYYPYYGRGYVQITWKYNYEKFSNLLKINLIKNPDLALNYKIATKIALLGMRDGLFTNKKLTDYMNNTKCDYYNARKIINGTDKANKIKKLAINYEVIVKDFIYKL